MYSLHDHPECLFTGGLKNQSEFRSFRLRFLAEAWVMSSAIFVSEASIFWRLSTEKNIALQRIAPPSLQRPTTTNITTMAAAGGNGPLSSMPRADASERARWGSLVAKT